MSHKIVMLHQTDNLQVYRCAGCRQYHVNYRNIFLHFSSIELRGFIKILRKLQPQHYTCMHPEGPKAIISKTRHIGGIGFTEEETNSIIGQLEQALLMDEVNNTLAQEKN